MTDTEINIAIAEACGWTRSMPNIHGMDGHLWTNGKNVALHCPPDYCHDLNAMHEAEKTLMEGESVGYVDALLSSMHRVDTGYFTSITWWHAAELVSATARQRAEAFLRVKGLWKGEE